MWIDVDRTRCVCSSACADIAPSVFRVDDDGLSVIDSNPPETLRQDLELAAELCPTSAISVAVS